MCQLREIDHQRHPFAGILRGLLPLLVTELGSTELLSRSTSIGDTGKKVLRRRSAFSCSSITPSSPTFKTGMPWPARLTLVYAYAFHMFSRLSRNSTHCSLSHCSILSMRRRRISLTLSAASATSSPLRLTAVRWLRVTLNENRSVFSLSVNHRLVYGDGRALATFSSKTPLTTASTLSKAASNSSLLRKACVRDPCRYLLTYLFSSPLYRTYA